MLQYKISIFYNLNHFKMIIKNNYKILKKLFYKKILKNKKNGNIYKIIVNFFK